MNLNDRLSEMCHDIDICTVQCTQIFVLCAGILPRKSCHKSADRTLNSELASVKMKWAGYQRYKISTDISDKVQAILNFVLKFEGC